MKPMGMYKARGLGIARNQAWIEKKYPRTLGDQSGLIVGDRGEKDAPYQANPPASATPSSAPLSTSLCTSVY
ncbi:MAG TPA: hypothetical protein PK988_02530, partial [Candidatus Sumerlaeota bacterium]|nr:hypothetical protein [Candidatus Sumerlaeota bacterium]